MHHATKESVMVSNAREEKALGPEWSRACIFREYPRAKYHWNGKNVTVKNPDEEAALGRGWANNPSTFEAYKGPRRTRIEERDPCKWLDEWSVPGLSSEHQKKIKAQLLRADGAFERSSDADPESAALACMRLAFDGTAQVLFDGRILTEDLLRKEIRELVWNSAIAGGWWRRASETRQDIFPEQRGHYWVWVDDSRDSKELFRAETRDWEARLLEAPGPKAPARVSTTALQEVASVEPRSGRKRGPTPDYATASRVAKIVADAAPNGEWRTRLDDICMALDDENIHCPKTWKVRHEFGNWYAAIATGNTRARDMAVKAIKHHLDLAKENPAETIS